MINFFQQGPGYESTFRIQMKWNLRNDLFTDLYTLELRLTFYSKELFNSIRSFAIIDSLKKKLYSLNRIAQTAIKTQFYSRKLHKSSIQKSGKIRIISYDDLSLLLQHLHELHPALVSILLLISTLFTSLCKPDTQYQYRD